MERNKWETAIRCLEIALHPKAADAEVLAAVNGFRRTAGGRPLRDLCVELFGKAHAGSVPAYPAKLQDKVDRLQQENLDLRRQLDLQRSDHAVTRRRLHLAERHLRDLRDDLSGAERRAEAAEQRADATERRADTAERRAEAAERRLADLRAPTAKPAAPFHSLLKAARLRADLTEAARPHRSATPDKGHQNGDPPLNEWNPPRPWTA